jgi:hypothetical protein
MNAVISGAVIAITYMVLYANLIKTYEIRTDLGGVSSSHLFKVEHGVTKCLSTNRVLNAYSRALYCPKTSRKKA